MPGHNYEPAIEGGEDSLLGSVHIPGKIETRVLTAKVGNNGFIDRRRRRGLSKAGSTLGVTEF